MGTFGPTVCMGANMMANVVTMQLMVASGMMIPARINEEPRTYGEASLGLVTAPAFTLTLALFDDLIKTFLAQVFLFGLHAIWWDDSVCHMWTNGGKISGIFFGSLFVNLHVIATSTAL